MSIGSKSVPIWVTITTCVASIMVSVVITMAADRISVAKDTATLQQQVDILNRQHAEFSETLGKILEKVDKNSVLMQQVIDYQDEVRRTLKIGGSKPEVR
jgi:hypothetical protein